MPTNVHFTYKGYSIIIDYEYKLHPYHKELIKNHVPVEVYPCGKDVFVFYVFCKENTVDIQEIINEIDEIESSIYYPCIISKINEPIVKHIYNITKSIEKTAQILSKFIIADDTDIIMFVKNFIE